MGDLNDYLSTIADLDDANDGGSFQEETNHQQETTQEPSGQQPANQQADQQDQQGVDQTQQDRNATNAQQSNQGQDQQSQQTQEVRRPVGRHGSGQFVDAQGNIVTREGLIIAKAGRERRDYERFMKVSGNAQQMSQRAQQLEQELQQVQFLNNVPRQYGLSNDDVALGLDVARRMKAGDLLGIAREFVALAASKGVNISQIVGEKAGDAIDMAAVRAMLDERLAPLTQGQRQSQQEVEAEQVARQRYEQFVNDNEYADVHGDVIVATMQRNGVSMQAAYNQVRDFAIANRLDFSIPLGPQIEALARRQQTQQPSMTQQRPLPSSSASTREVGVQTPSVQYADPDDDWGSIIRNAMRNSSAPVN
jgi:hypothetical protein